MQAAGQQQQEGEPLYWRVWTWITGGPNTEEEEEEDEKEVPPEWTCAVCFDVLTDPVRLPQCGHAQCRLCTFLMFEAYLRHEMTAPWYAPGAPPVACPRCRAPIPVRYHQPVDEALGEAIRRRFPKLVKAKAEGTHSVAEQTAAQERVLDLVQQLAAKLQREEKWEWVLWLLLLVPLFLRWVFGLIRRGCASFLRLCLLLAAVYMGLQAGAGVYFYYR